MDKVTIKELMTRDEVLEWEIILLKQELAKLKRLTGIMLWLLSIGLISLTLAVHEIAS